MYTNFIYFICFSLFQRKEGRERNINRNINWLPPGACDGTQSSHTTWAYTHFLSQFQICILILAAYHILQSSTLVSLCFLLPGWPIKPFVYHRYLATCHDLVFLSPITLIQPKSIFHPICSHRCPYIELLSPVLTLSSTFHNLVTVQGLLMFFLAHKGISYYHNQSKAKTVL